MRRLVWVVVAAALLWAGYWVAISLAIGRGAEAWLAARQAEGWQAEAGDIAVQGFPLRFDTTLTGLALADPETGLAWEAPAFRVQAAAHRPHHVTAIWPAEQTVATPLQRITVTTADLRAEATLVPGAALVLDRAQVVMDDMRLASTLGWDAAIERGRLTLQRTAGAPPESYSHDLTFEATGYTLPALLRRGLDPAGLLPDRIEGLRADMSMTFDRPWDRFAIEDRRPQPRSIEVRSLSADWGRLALRVAGQVAIDTEGRPEGRITVRAENWREMVGLAVNAGVLPQGLARTVERGLEILAALGPNPDVLDAPLSFQGGFMSLGPIPLGPAPRLVLR
jgi:hypothetical protein